jgi:hypothetical protein
MAWSPPEDSPAAALDENEYLARVAADLAACEPLPMKPTPAPQYVTQRELDPFEALRGARQDGETGARSPAS